MKRRKKYIFILVVFLLLFCSCNQQSLNEWKIYKIDLSEVTDCDFFSLVDSVYYVELETNQSNSIGDIAKLQVNDYISILDRVSNTIQIYSLTGKLMAIISHIGNGPGEYVRISDFVVYPNTKEIEVLDGMQNKIVRYAFSGEAIIERNISLSPGVSRFSAQGECYFFDQQIRANKMEEKYNLIQASFDGKIMKRNLPYNRSSDVVLSSRNSLFCVNDSLVYLPTYSSVVYNVVDGGVEPRYSFDFGEKWMDEDYLYSKPKNPMLFVNGLKDTHGIYFFNVNESRSHLFLDFMYKDEKYYAIVRKGDSLVTLCRISQKEGCTMKNLPFTSFGDYFVIPIDRYEAPEQFRDKGTEEFNPILMFVKFK